MISCDIGSMDYHLYFVNINRFDEPCIMTEQTEKTFIKKFNDDAAQKELPFYLKREFLVGLLVILVTLAMYLPNLGGYALWDPWEPHYSQVAMEMNQVDTWMVPTYRHSNRWFSKPVILFWFLKPSFMVFGQTEFAARFPIVLISIFGLVMFNFLMGRLFNWKVGLLTTLILATSPQFFFIARQTIFDGVYVVFQMLAFGFLLLGLFKYPDKLRWIMGFWIFSGLAMLSKGLLAIVLPVAAVGTYIIVTWDWAMLKRMRIGRGLLVFAAVAAPWFVFMTWKFGYSYFHSFFIYHHFERAAGLIHKPNSTFDLYVRQIFFATFPWCAFLPMALVRFLRYGSDDIYGRTRKNLMLFLIAVMPYIFFTLSSTKFHHYIFPVIPFLAVIVAVYLAKLISQPEKPIVRLEIILAVFIFAIMAKDLVTNYKYLIHLFIYYYDRALPKSVNPRDVFYAFFIPMGLVMGVPLIWKKVKTGHVVALGVLAIGFSIYCNAFLMPALTDTFSQKKLWEAYNKLATNNEPVCEYHSWERRSVSYYFNNKSEYLSSRKSNTTKRFFSKPGKLFCMVDRNVFSKLRNKVKSENDRDLYIVNSDHPFTYLVATEPPESLKKTKGKYVLNSPPIVPNRVEAEFEGKIRLLGYETDKKSYRIGEPITLVTYYEVLQDMDTDYTIFIHGRVSGGGGRMIGDHTPVNGTHPTDQWKKGTYIMDKWSGRISKRVSSGHMNFYIGFFNDKGRLEVTKGPNDGENRVKIGSVRIKN